MSCLSPSRPLSSSSTCAAARERACVRFYPTSPPLPHLLLHSFPSLHFLPLPSLLPNSLLSPSLLPSQTCTTTRRRSNISKMQSWGGFTTAISGLHQLLYIVHLRACAHALSPLSRSQGPAHPPQHDIERNGRCYEHPTQAIAFFYLNKKRRAKNARACARGSLAVKVTKL